MGKNTFSWPLKILFLFSVMLVALFVVAVVIVLFFGVDTTSINSVITMSILQNLVAFVLPVIMLAIMNKRSELTPLSHTLWMSKGPTFKSIALVVLVWIVAMPAMNYVVELNQSLEFPSNLKWMVSERFFPW